MKTLLFIFVLLFSVSLFAQDSTKVQEKKQTKEQVKKQERIRVSDKFVDEDGDGINDNAVHQFNQAMFKGEGQHQVKNGQMTQEKAGTQSKNQHKAGGEGLGQEKSGEAKKSEKKQGGKK